VSEGQGAVAAARAARRAALKTYRKFSHRSLDIVGQTDARQDGRPWPWPDSPSRTGENLPVALAVALPPLRVSFFVPKAERRAHGLGRYGVYRLFAVHWFPAVSVVDRSCPSVCRSNRDSRAAWS
jgi:hypothetical protein